MTLEGDIRIKNSAGYDIWLRTARIDFNTGGLVSEEPVRVILDGGTIAAKQLDVSDNGHKVSFGGEVTSMIDAEAERARNRRRLDGQREMTRRLGLAVVVLLLMAWAVFPAYAEKPRSDAILPGGNSKDPVNIDAAKLDYFDKEQKLVYTGNVVATQGESKLEAGRLVIFLTPKDAAAPTGVPSSSSQIRRMEAAGPVTIVSKDQIGTGDSGIYEKSENKVYLIGNVTLTQGPNVTKGDKLIYDMNTKQAAVTGRVRSKFLPNGGTGDAKEPRPARPDGATKPDHAARPPDTRLSLGPATFSLVTVATPMPASGVCLRRRGADDISRRPKIAMAL